MQQHDTATELIKAVPAVGYLGATVGGMSLPDWAALLAIVYTSVLLVQLIYKAQHKFRHWRNNRRAIRAAKARNKWRQK